MRRRKVELIPAQATIEGLIERGELLIWIHHHDGTSALVTATAVCINGNAVQVEADPTWTFGGK